MTSAELQEILDLNGWSKTKLAAEIDVSESCVHRWLMYDKIPGGPTSILLRQMLEAAKASEKKLAKAV